jgi:hypothetical protein
VIPASEQSFKSESDLPSSFGGIGDLSISVPERILIEEPSSRGRKRLLKKDTR